MLTTDQVKHFKSDILAGTDRQTAELLAKVLASAFISSNKNGPRVPIVRFARPSAR